MVGIFEKVTVLRLFPSGILTDIIYALLVSQLSSASCSSVTSISVSPEDERPQLTLVQNNLCNMEPLNITSETRSFVTKLHLFKIFRIIIVYPQDPSRFEAL